MFHQGRRERFVGLGCSRVAVRELQDGRLVLVKWHIGKLDVVERRGVMVLMSGPAHPSHGGGHHGD